MRKICCYAAWDIFKISGVIACLIFGMDGWIVAWKGYLVSSAGDIPGISYNTTTVISLLFKVAYSITNQLTSELK